MVSIRENPMGFSAEPYKLIRSLTPLPTKNELF